MEWRESSESGLLELFLLPKDQQTMTLALLTLSLVISNAAETLGRQFVNFWQSIEHLRAIKEGPHDISGEQDECKTVAAQEVWTTPT